MLKKLGNFSLSALFFLCVGQAICATTTEVVTADYKLINNNVKPMKHDFLLDMLQPALWTIDTVHLGTKQLKIEQNTTDQATVITPLWSPNDIHAKDAGIRNIAHSRLHLYQLINASDCTQAEIFFEILIPREYIEEGKMEFVFSLQAGSKGDYLFNGRTFNMDDFSDTAGQYKKIIVKASSDFTDAPSAQKLRAIERVNFIFHRNGSMVEAPIKIRRVAIDLHADKIMAPEKDEKVINPSSFYLFSYNTQKMIDGFYPRISDENLDISRKLNSTKTAMVLTPRWLIAQMPSGHSGKVTLIQPLGAIHDFERFEVQYLINVPKEYFKEGKLNIYLFIQAGEAGFSRWSGTERKLSSFSDKAGQDVLLTMTERDFLEHGKKRNQIEMVGLQLNPNGSSVTKAITLKSITVKLPE